MENNAAVNQFKDNQRRFQERLEALRFESESVLAELDRRQPSPAEIDRLNVVALELEKLFEESREQSRAFVGYLRQLEASNRRPVMPTEKRAKKPASQAEIEKLSEELTTKLRLDRVDAAIKELLAFLADDAFFAANASTGRRRRLRALENALQSLLGK